MSFYSFNKEVKKYKLLFLLCKLQLVSDETYAIVADTFEDGLRIQIALEDLSSRIGSLKSSIKELERLK